MIATKFAEESNIDVNSGYPDFDLYVVQLKETNDLKEEKRVVEKAAAFNDPEGNETLAQYQDKQNLLFDKITQLEDDITDMSQKANLPNLSGRMTDDLDKVLQKNKIMMQVYYGRSFWEITVTNNRKKPFPMTSVTVLSETHSS